MELLKIPCEVPFPLYVCAVRELSGVRYDLAIVYHGGLDMGHTGQHHKGCYICLNIRRRKWKLYKWKLSTSFHGYYSFPCFQQLGSRGKVHNNKNKYSNKIHSDLTNQPTKNLNIPKLAEADRGGLCICMHSSYFPIKFSWWTECLCLQFKVHWSIVKFVPALSSPHTHNTWSMGG